MNVRFRATVAAIAFTALAAQPTAANAVVQQVGSSSASAASTVVWPMVFGFGFILCTGMTMGLQDTQAAALGLTVRNVARLRAFIGCAIPPLGFYRLITHQPPPQ